jgi:hypothetical protein
MKPCRTFHAFRPCLLALIVLPNGWSQTNPGDIVAMYSVNYSSADRKQTLQPGFVGPAFFTYRPNCRVMAGIDDDTFVSNKTATGRVTGTGDLGFEGHLTLWRGYPMLGDGKCAAGKLASLTLDYIATVPVPGTLEGTELNHLTKLTWNRPLGGGDTGNVFADVGFNVQKVPQAGTAINAVASVNYLRFFKPGGAWDAFAEVDFTSPSKLGPTAVAILYGIDGTFDKNQTWTFRIGASSGLTPYAPKVSPFIQIFYNGKIKPQARSAMSTPGHIGVT